MNAFYYVGAAFHIKNEYYANIYRERHCEDAQEILWI